MGEGIKTKIFLDSGDPEETKQIIKLLGFLDGQTTNPTLISKNPEAVKRLEKGEKFTKEEILKFYKRVVSEISSLIPQGSISIEVYADKNTKAEDMLEQGREMFSWIPNAHIKFPTNAEGLKAAQQAIKEGLRVTMTICFSQAQAAAVYAATRGFNNVFVAPYVGRLDDRGENGMDLIKNIIKMYKSGDGHVEVLAASIRNINHLLYAVKLGTDIVTCPLQVLTEWSETGLKMPDENSTYHPVGLKPIEYEELDLNKNWQDFDISHELTDIGMERFSNDWNALIK